MKKTYLAGFVVVVIVALGIVTVPKTMAKKPIKEDRSITIDGATPENPVVYLGKSFDKKSGKEVEGYAIVHYAKNANKPTKPSSGTTCYGYIAKGAKWKETPEPWVIDYFSNSQNLDPYVLKDNMEADINKWEDASDGIVGNGIGTEILGQGSVDTVSATLGKSLDNKNEVEFASINNLGAIAVTYIWGIFGGPTFQRELVEWDQVYDDVDFNWSMTGEAGKMDFENIATHELGHSVGMGDLYNLSCSTQTMYGYAGYGETDKRILESGDITGINLLY